MKTRITKHCVLTSGGVENNGAHSNNIVFAIKDFLLQNYMSLSSLYQQKKTKIHQNVLAKGLKDQFSGTNMKQKVKTIIRQMNVDTFSIHTL